MRTQVGAITFDAADPEKLASFWAAALDREARPARAVAGAWALPEGESGPMMLFLPVPEPKTAKNRCHVDLHTGVLEAELQRLEALGATVVEHHHDPTHWVVLRDVEGNELCLVEDSSV
jgi:predicted enzyme related to lactoylglutathione lyase